MSRCSQWGWRLGTALLVIVTSGIAGRPREAFAQGRGGFSVPGLVEPADGVLSIGTAATGVISSMVARPGERVRQGEEIVRIDCAPLEASVKSLAAQSLAAQAVADRVRNGPRPAEIDVGRANLGVARARAEEAADALHRTQALQVGISVTQAVMLQVQRDARITAAQLEDARARLELLRLGSRAEDIEEADARRDGAAAALDEAKARLAQCRVASPIDGVVVARHATVGQFVSAAVPTVLLQIEDDKNFDLRVDVEETHLADLCLGQRASAATLGGTALTATVERIAPTIEPLSAASAPQGEAAPGHIAATLKLDQQNSRLIPGQRVTVRFEPCRS